MNSLKPLFKVNLKLLTLMLCLTAAVPQMWGATWTVVGANNGFLGSDWSTTDTNNDMLQYNSTIYYLARTANVNSGSYAFKVAKDHSWATAYPSSNYNYSVSSTGTWSIVYIFNTSGNAVSLFGPFKTLTVAGGQTEVLGSSWGQTDANNDMSSTDGINYKLTFTDVNVTAGNYECKIVQDHAWTYAWPSSNKQYSVSFTGLADIEYAFNVITKDVTITVTEKSVTPVTPDYYITGDNGLGLGGFKYNPTTNMTYDSDNDCYIYNYNVTTPGTYYFAFADGQGSSWDDFNNNHRIGPNGNMAVNLNGGWTPTQKGSGSYYVTVDIGQVTITLDVNNMRFKVDGTAPVIPVDYYVVGNDTGIFPNGWSNGSETLMTEDNGIYTWTANNVHLTAGTDYVYKVHGSDDSWYPASSNATFNVNANGTYNVVFTFDGTNVNAVATLVLEDQAYTYDIYVRYEGNEPIGNVYAYTFDTYGVHHLGDWGGTALSSLTPVTINGYTYYHTTVTSYDPQVKIIFNENQSGSTQTANLDLQTGDNYFTYGGGSVVTGPTAQPDEAPVIDYYVVGDDTGIFPNGWSNGSETLMTENDGTYTWTTNNVHLTAGTDYAYKVHGSDDSWYPSSSNATFNVNANGTYNVVFTFDGTNVNAVATLVLVDQTYTYDIYVRYEGNEPIGNVYAYTFDTYGVHHLGDWGGTALSALTPVTINGYTYYHTTITSYDPQVKIIFNENQSGSTQTANLDLQTGDNYFTYGGGSVVDGPNDEADSRAAIYLIGHANSQQWAANAGIPMEWDETTGFYKLENVVLTSMSNFAFATQLGSSSSDWETLNNYRLSSIGNNNYAIVENLFNTWIAYQNYSTAGENHNWYVEQAGVYNIYVDPATRRIMLSPLHQNMYISYGVDWSYENNSVQMTTVDGNVYQTTISLNNGDYFLFSTNLNDNSAWGAVTPGYEISDIMIGFAQQLVEDSINNYKFTGSTGRYIVVVNKNKGTVILRRTNDATVTKIFLQKTSNVTLDPAGGTYNHQTLGGKRGGIYAWNKLNLEAQQGQTYSYAVGKGPTNYTYENEVENNYSGNKYLKDLPDTITADGKNWYAWSVSNSICEFYFIRNNKQDNKSQKVMRRAGEVWLTWIDEDATTNRQDNAQHLDSLLDVTRQYYDVSAGGVSDCATMLEGHYYAYYTNTTGWDSVYCYAWSEIPYHEFTDEYPGTKCTFVGYDEDGYEVWCYDFGLMEQFGDIEPTNIIFDNGLGGADEGAEGDSKRQQTGDLVFDNGACYDYLGMIYLGNSLNAIINGGIVNGPKYTVEDDLIGVYYDDNAITKIVAFDKDGQEVDHYVKGALYAKDLENYTAKSRLAEGTTDYVYDICAHTESSTYPGGSQIQLMRPYYDQSNWVKIVLSPNFDNTNAKSNGDVTIDADQFDNMDFAHAQELEEGYLKRYVGKVIPGHSMSGNLVNNVNPQMHITNIAYPIPTEKYEENVYVTAHFNDSIVFSYVHQDWSPGIYKGVYRTVPHMAYNDRGQAYVDTAIVDSTVLYKMFYVAPKPQEVAYITWAVFDHPNPNGNIGTTQCLSEPSEPGAFYAPMNWNRQGQLWDGTDPNDPNGAWGTTYGPYSNGYMQYGAFKVNWSLFEDMEIDPLNPNRDQLPWYQIFKPGQAYKILAVIRYAYGETEENVEYTPGVYSGTEYNEGSGNHVANAPRRDNFKWDDMQHTPYRDLEHSKFIVFPLKGSSENSNGNGIGNVTSVDEVATARTIVAMQYYNLMGMRSDKPFDGINIVVTFYSDGTRTSQKKIIR